MLPEVRQIQQKARKEGLESLDQDDLLVLQNAHLLDAAQQDFMMFQEEVGLLDEADNVITKERILRLYPHWQKLGVKLRPRVVKFYESNKD